MMMFSKNNSSKVHALIMEQIKDVDGCLIAFESFMEAALKPETSIETLRAFSSGVHQMENAADRSLRVMIDSLGGTFLPSSREELISIATSCDKVANKCEHISLMMVYQRFRFPQEYNEAIAGMLVAVRKQFDLLKESISMLFSRFGDLLEDHSILIESANTSTKWICLKTSSMERSSRWTLIWPIRCRSAISSALSATLLIPLKISPIRFRSC